MAASDIGYLTELAGTGITADCTRSGPELAGFLYQLPELADALADSLIELSEYMDSSGLAGEAGEHIAEAGIAARVMYEAAVDAGTAFTRENRFWLKSTGEHPDSTLGELAERVMSGFIPDEPGHLIAFLQGLPAFAGAIAHGLACVAEAAGETHLGETVSEKISEVAVQAGMIRECADEAWGAFEDAHAFWLATR